MNLISMITSWIQASQDLNIIIRAPFILTTEDNLKIRYELFVESFGSPLGTVILDMNDMTDFNIPKKNGYYCSALNPERYGTYDRQLFIDTLNDWGYYGDKSKTPEWYTGQSWID
jgi:hypothetical protein